MERIITKDAFAKICGTSRPTLNKWIKADKDGIAAYVTSKGIDASIFEVDPWSRFNVTDPSRSGSDASEDDHSTMIEQLRAERDQLAAQVDDLRGQILTLENQLAAKDEHIQDLRNTVGHFAQIADQAQRLQMQQLKALPSGRQHRTFGEAFKDFFGIKRKAEEESDQM